MHGRACTYAQVGIVGVTALICVLTSRWSSQGASPLKPSTPAQSATITSTSVAGEHTDEALEARTSVRMLCYISRLIMRTTGHE